MKKKEEQVILFCPACGGEAFLHNRLVTQPLGGHRRFPYQIACSMRACGLQTPFVAVPSIAVALWNRRVKRKPPHRAVRRRIP